MRVRPQLPPRHRLSAASSPLPHPSWSPPRDGRRVSAQEFWQRLGL